ncbi:hypothetical protein COLO4_21861 [Corchorus olitorius]|uniref:RNase H type-1 domain-containing protein n=1 Tax=Corchorus olitorius TaxID=93759 RepID=A0A1R3IQB7_9ROSI|nr:hypothetical protein COLO4_21861 [Corchorus olitorius]
MADDTKSHHEASMSDLSTTLNPINYRTGKGDGGVGSFKLGIAKETPVLLGGRSARGDRLTRRGDERVSQANHGNRGKSATDQRSGRAAKVAPTGVMKDQRHGRSSQARGKPEAVKEVRCENQGEVNSKYRGEELNANSVEFVARIRGVILGIMGSSASNVKVGRKRGSGLGIVEANICYLPSSFIIMIRRNVYSIGEAADVEVANHASSSGSWSPPPEGVIKLNVDAAYHSASKVAVLAMVLRNANGSVLACGLVKRAGVPSALHAELLAILFGLEEAKGALLGRPLRISFALEKVRGAPVVVPRLTNA